MNKITNDFNTSSNFEPQFISPSSNGDWGRNAKLSYCEYMQKNKPQSNSVAGGLLVLGAGGYHIGWLLWNVFKPHFSTTTLFFQFSCWYFGSIIGNILGAVIVTKWQKKNVYYACGTISIIGSIIFVAWFHIDWLLAVGRFVSGLGHGIAYVATITHGAENVIKEMRGRLISSVNVMIYSSVFTLAIVMMFTSLPGGIRTEQMVGLLAISFAIMGVLFTPCLTYESVTFLLYRNNDRQAAENMKKLRNESEVTWTISNDLQEMKLMVTEDRMKSPNITKDSNTRPLLLMMACSCVAVLTSNIILNTHLIQITMTSFMPNWQPDSETPDSAFIAAVILVTFRFSAGMIMILFGDSFSRKKCLWLSAGLSMVCLLITQILSSFVLNYSNGVNWIPGAFAVAFQLFVGVGVESIQHVLTSEAFSTAKKYWSIACVAISDSIIQIAIIGLCFIESSLFLAIFVYCSIVIVALLTVLLYIKLPETRGISLRQARNEFTKTSNIPEGITYS
ncbi:low-affinity glucose transporter HXT3-like [Bradysia coprophila]|uniref:low-affinity glucose transporter HXT3-like n=1 Tax=Bradysia coprophila TaxID=38358 RepID=UPI00187D8BE1|nr:low-affinity glucose transporter HXT3-like [Bradysia coprophila]